MANDSAEKRSIIREKLVQPSMIVPTLYVGLGGCGCKIVRRIVDHIRRRPDYHEQYEGLTKTAFVDTNINDLEKHRDVADDTFLISDFEKKAYAELAGGKDYLDPDPYFTQWVPSDYKFRSGDTAGAGQIRIESRLGSYYQVRHRDFVAKFRRLLEGLKDHAHGHRRLESNDIRIVICYSIAGGTGSGSHLPVAYLLRELASQFGKPMLLGVAVLPSVFEDKTGANKDGTFANGYAALKETEHLMKLGAPETRFSLPDAGIEFHYNPMNPTKTHVQDKPFDFLYVIDRPESMTVKSVEDAAADGLYLQLYSPLFQEQLGDYDNYTQHQRFLVPQDFEAKGIPGYTSFYASYGAAVLHVPTPGLIEYCAAAAAMGLVKECFVAQIPSSELYSSVRANEDEFFQIEESEDKTLRENNKIKEAEFKTRRDDQRAKLEDRLFMKRTRMLAKAEKEKEKRGLYWEIFRHGHALGSEPEVEGVKPGKISVDDEKLLKENEMNFSIAHFALASLAPAESAGPPLLEAVKNAVIGMKDQVCATGKTEGDANTVDNDIRNEIESMNATGMKVLREGVQAGIKGFEIFEDLRFLDARASGRASIAAKRYAVLNLLATLKTKQVTVEQSEEAPTAEKKKKGIEKYDQKTLRSAREAKFDIVAAEVIQALEQNFYGKMSKLLEELARMANTYRLLQQGLTSKIEPEERRIDLLASGGDTSANMYALDSEALQIESGRRLWDYFYEDHISGIGDLSLGSPEIARLLSDNVRDLAKGGGGDSTLSDKLYGDLLKITRIVVKRIIEGDIYAEEVSARHGITLEEALKLEVEYRALYLSKREEIDAASDKRAVVAKQMIAHRSKRTQVNLKDSLHYDYLRDKLKRIVKERSDLLCYLDEKHLQQGGIRPDEVFLCAIHRDLATGVIGELLKKGLGINPPRPVTNGWDNLREVIFYRAILCVPLFVFGRMKEMQAYYHQFKNASRRSKVLHIDKNWENTLPDLDPEDVEEAFRKQFLRDRIVDFATLLALEKPGTDMRCIGRVDGSYELRSIAAHSVTDDDFELAPAKLGDTIELAARKLREVLDAEGEKYADYRQFLELVRAGCSPEVLLTVTRVPFEWKKTVETMRTRFSNKLDDDQRRRMVDYENAFTQLREALGKLRDGLRISLAEYQATGDRPRAACAFEPDEYRELAGESVRLLEKFIEEYDNPDRAGSLQQNPFKSLFKPMGRDRLDKTLRDSLRPRRAGLLPTTAPKVTPNATGLPAAAEDVAEPKGKGR